MSMKATEDRVVTNVNLPRAVIEQIDRIAAKQSRSRSGQVTHALKEWLEARSDSAAPPRERK
jgi:metal-responsive CopG/Arc/MetJ family transcriptional regulator